jgi:hypothetical protein
MEGGPDKPEKLKRHFPGDRTFTPDTRVSPIDRWECLHDGYQWLDRPYRRSEIEADIAEHLAMDHPVVFVPAGESPREWKQRRGE